MAIRLTCLCLAFRENAVQETLLIHKRRGANQGRWTPCGGKIEPGETPLMAAAREFREESGLAPLNLRPFGLVTQDEPPDLWLLHLALIENWQGELQPSDEGEVAWINRDALAGIALPHMDHALWPHLWRAWQNKEYIDAFASHDASGELLELKVQIFPFG